MSALMPTPAGPLTGLRILVVDDTRDCAESQALLLCLHGHDAHAAFGGQEALEKARLMDFDVVILDIGMPGMDGCEVARRMRRMPELDQTVLAALTGWGQQEDRRRTAEAGFDHHLVKPPEPKAVENLLFALAKPS